MNVVHIGFPKTATTFLQMNVFPRLPGFAYFDKKAASPFLAPLMSFDDTIFDAEGSKRNIETAWNGREDVLFSDESLTGLHHRVAFVNRTLIARRLKGLGFERVIVTIRNQFDALEATYKQHIKSGGVLKFDEYVTFGSDEPRYFYPEYFDYYPIYGLYAELFGASNVLILQYENLEKDVFAKDLFGFLGVEPFDIDFAAPANPSLSYEKTKLLRVINHVTYNSFQPSHLISKRISTQFFYRLLSRVGLLESRKSFLTARKRAIIASFYAAGNRMLEEKAAISLAPDYP